MDNILIIEDDEYVDILYEKLSAFYNITFADTTNTAIAKLNEKDSFACVMVNVALKGQYIIELFEYMEKTNLFEDMAVAIAVEDFDNIDERILEYDISEIIQKPYGTYTLAKRLDNIIRLKMQKSELRSSNIELAKAYESAKKAIELKSRFLLNTSHDIRTPMNAIIGMTEMAKKYIDDKKMAEKCIDNVMTASDHLLNILNDILDMSYIEKEQMSYNIIECSLGNVIKELSVIIKQQCDNKNLKYELRINKLINDCVWANPTRLTQMFINILSNSIKYTEPGGVVGLDISEKTSGDNEYCNYVFRFYDNGNGMSKEFVENVFVPFAREENMDAPYVEGTGLGMAITKSIIDSMGGTIDVASKEGVGTQITVTLRLKKAAGFYQDDTSLQNALIYVYDMNKEHGKHIVKMFDAIGIEVYYRDSLQYIFEEEKKYNILIVSLSRMDEKNLDTLLNIRLQMPDIKIIQIESPMYKVSEEVNIFDGVVKKPFFPSDMLDMVKNVVDNDNANKGEEYYFEDLRVLVVDDNMINRMIMAEFLESVRIDTVQSESAADAIELLKDAPEGYYDMVLMDIQMPDIDGCEATQIIRRLNEGYHRNVPIVAVTAEAFPEDKKRAVEVGMNDYLCKPFKREKLYKCIEKYTDTKIKKV